MIKVCKYYRSIKQAIIKHCAILPWLLHHLDPGLPMMMTMTKRKMMMTMRKMMMTMRKMMMAMMMMMTMRKMIADPPLSLYLSVWEPIYQTGTSPIEGGASLFSESEHK